MTRENFVYQSHVGRRLQSSPPPFTSMLATADLGVRYGNWEAAKCRRTLWLHVVVWRLLVA